MSTKYKLRLHVYTVVQPVELPVVSCRHSYNGLFNRLLATTGWKFVHARRNHGTTGCITCRTTVWTNTPRAFLNIHYQRAALRAAQACRYLVYSEADLRFFAPRGRHVAPIGVKLGMEEGTDAKFHLHRCNDKGVGPHKLKFLLRFDRNLEHKRPAGAYPLRDFHKICRFCTAFQAALGV